VLSMADRGLEGKGQKATGRYGVPEKITIDGSETNRVDAKAKMRYKPFASCSWRPRWHVGDALLLSPRGSGG
jgi:hypothetical protein